MYVLEAWLDTWCKIQCVLTWQTHLIEILYHCHTDLHYNQALLLKKTPLVITIPLLFLDGVCAFSCALKCLLSVMVLVFNLLLKWATEMTGGIQTLCKHMLIIQQMHHYINNSSDASWDLRVHEGQKVACSS